MTVACGLPGSRNRRAVRVRGRVRPASSDDHLEQEPEVSPSLQRASKPRNSYFGQTRSRIRQGYHLAVPVRLEQLTRMLEAWSHPALAVFG